MPTVLNVVLSNLDLTTVPTADAAVTLTLEGPPGLPSTVPGPTGPTGAAGATGATGSAGATGAVGSAGANGATWRDGAGVPSNSLGANGDYYLNDTNGSVYLKSAGSYAVVASIVGPTGVAGVDGKTVRNGTGVPSSGLGVDGDFYIDTAASTIYGPKTAGTWGSATSLIGPAGATGAAGPPGRVQAVLPGTNVTVDSSDPANPVVSASGGGGGNFLPIASPTGATVTTTPNTITGVGTIDVLTFPAETPVVAWKLAGDTFPRVVFGTNPGDYGAFFLGDGTYDPVNLGASLSLGAVVEGAALSVGRLSAYSLDINAGGLIIVAPDATRHRLKVANDGTLSTEVV